MNHVNAIHVNDDCPIRSTEADTIVGVFNTVGAPIKRTGTPRGDYIFVDMRFPNGKSCGAAADTACTTQGVMMKEYVRNLGLEKDIQKGEEVKLVMANGNVTYTDEVLHTQVFIGNMPHMIKFIICNDLQTGALIGQPVLRKIGVYDVMRNAIDKLNKKSQKKD